MTDLVQLRNKIKERVTKIFDMMDTSGRNSESFQNMIDRMSDTKFNEWMAALKKGESKITLEMPNMKSEMTVPNLLKAAKETGTHIFQQLIKTDPETGRKYKTPKKYPILSLPIRRTQQTIEKKMSIPSRNTAIDASTGQVTGDAKASGIGKEEIQILHNRGLNNTLAEFLQIRGGNPEEYSRMVQQLQETGVSDIDPAEIATKTRTSETVNTLLAGMLLESDF